MNIHLLDQNSLERQALFSFFEHKECKVTWGQDITTISLNPLTKNEPSFLVIDTNYLFHLSALKKIKCLEKIDERFKIILLGKLDQLHWFSNFETNARGFICKQGKTIYLLKVLKELKCHEFFFDQSVQDFLRMKKNEKQKILFREKIKNPLTKTELKVLRGVGKGKPTHQIAEEWYKSPHTINNHRKNILKKLKLSGSHSLLLFSIRHLNAIRTLVFLNNNERQIKEHLQNDYN